LHPSPNCPRRVCGCLVSQRHLAYLDLLFALKSPVLRPRPPNWQIRRLHRRPHRSLPDCW
jgi:hypothetical protein